MCINGTLVLREVHVTILCLMILDYYPAFLTDGDRPYMATDVQICATNIHVLLK